MKHYVKKKIGCQLQKEMKNVCSDKVDSILCSKNSEALKSFKWADLITELNAHVPVLVSILHACTQQELFKIKIKTQGSHNCVMMRL